MKLGKQNLLNHSFAGSARDVFVLKNVKACYSTFWHSALYFNRLRALKRLVYLIKAFGTPYSAIFLFTFLDNKKLDFSEKIIRSRCPASFVSSVRQFWAKLNLPVLWCSFDVCLLSNGKLFLELQLHEEIFYCN